MKPTVSLASGLCRDRDVLMSREWLVTNGIGGYAMGTVAGAQTRAYHGYLIAATAPPVGRTLLVQHLDERIEHMGGVQGMFSSDEQAYRGLVPDDIVYRNAAPFLESFTLDGTLPVWTYNNGSGRIEKRVWMAYGRNTTYIQYKVLDGPMTSIDITLGINDRDHHGATEQDETSWTVKAADDGWSIVRQGIESATPWSLIAVPEQPFVLLNEWSERLFRRVEAERGLDAEEHRYELGTFSVTLSPGQSFTIICTTEPLELVEREVAVALNAEQERQAALLAQAGVEDAAPVVKQLVLAADQFIVERVVQGEAGTTSGHSVIAGYPWFGDWGRDTMISLPGLCLTTGRYEIAASILRTFARFVSQGMLPNRFPDVGEEPEYNTVDATLWYFHAIDQYVAATGDMTLVAELYPTLQDIVRWHLQGTRYGIGVDPSDGLLRAGSIGAQLTWMDVRIDASLIEEQAPELIEQYHANNIDLSHGLVVTPRHGKAVEINALWYNALRLMTIWQAQQSQHDNEPSYAALAEQVAASYSRFWCPERGYLYDVIDTPRGNDATLRPNQVFALSLLPHLLSEDQRRSALAAVKQHLMTSVGLRTLDPRHPDYQPRFTGNRFQRDSAYHQGTVWAWLIGHYLDAQRSLDPDFDAWSAVQPLLDHVWDVGLGTVSEVFDAEPPRFGAGCIAQAWSVAELLRSLRVSDTIS